MRTACSSSRLLGEGEVGCLPPWGGVSLAGGLLGRGLSLAGGLLARGVCFPGGVPPSRETLPCGQNSWHTLLKILPCPKLRLRAVKRVQSLKKFFIFAFALAQCKRAFITQSRTCALDTTQRTQRTPSRLCFLLFHIITFHVLI